MLSPAACAVPGLSEGCSAFSLINPGAWCSPQSPQSVVSTCVNAWHQKNSLDLRDGEMSFKHKQSVCLMVQGLPVVKTNKWLCLQVGRSYTEDALPARRHARRCKGAGISLPPFGMQSLGVKMLKGSIFPPRELAALPPGLMCTD